MLDNGTVTPLSGLGGGSTDYISAVSLNAGFDTLTFTGIGSAYNSTVDMSEYVTKTNYQLITGQKEFTIAGNFNALVSRASGTAPAFSSSGSGTGGAIYGKTSGTGSAIIGAVDAGSSAFAFQGGVLTNNPTFTVDKSGNIVANSIDIGGAGTEVLLDDGTTTPLKPYVSYVALVSQTGTSNPTAIVLENNLGGTVTFVRGAVGLYTANLTGAFTLDKVAIFLTNSADNIMSGNYFSTNAVGIQTSDRNGNLADNLFNKTSVEIRVYS